MSDELSDQALDCLLRTTLREGAENAAPLSRVWVRIVKRLRRDAPATYTQYSSFDISHQQQLLLFSAIRLESHFQFHIGGLLRAA